MEPTVWVVQSVARTTATSVKYLPNEPFEVDPSKWLAFDLVPHFRHINRQKLASKCSQQFSYLCNCRMCVSVCVSVCECMCGWVWVRVWGRIGCLCVVYYAALGNYICYPISVKLCLLAYDERIVAWNIASRNGRIELANEVVVVVPQQDSLHKYSYQMLHVCIS